MSEASNPPKGEALQDPEMIEDLVVVEAYGKQGKKPPKAKRYRIRIDREHYDVSVPDMKGRDILALAGKTPPEQWMLTQKLHGGQVKPIGLDEVVDFRAPGVERFMTLPLDQTEG
jgi:hypothetical protein